MANYLMSYDCLYLKYYYPRILINDLNDYLNLINYNFIIHCYSCYQDSKSFSYQNILNCYSYCYLDYFFLLIYFFTFLLEKEGYFGYLRSQS